MALARAHSPERPWIHACRLERAALTRPLDDVPLPPRVRRACAALNLRTVADVLGVDENEFMAQHGVGRRSWQRLVAIVRSTLFELTGDAPRQAQAALASAAFGDASARRALQRLGAPDGGVLLRAPRAAVLALPGVDADAYERLLAAGVQGPPAAAVTRDRKSVV